MTLTLLKNTDSYSVVCTSFKSLMSELSYMLFFFLQEHYGNNTMSFLEPHIIGFLRLCHFLEMAFPELSTISSFFSFQGINILLLDFFGGDNPS